MASPWSREPRDQTTWTLGSVLEEADRAVSHGDVAATGVEAAQAVHARAVPVAVPAAGAAVGELRVGGEQGVTEGPAEHALVPGLTQVAHVGPPGLATGGGSGGGTGTELDPLLEFDRHRPACSCGRCPSLRRRPGRFWRRLMTSCGIERRCR